MFLNIFFVLNLTNICVNYWIIDLIVIIHFVCFLIVFKFGYKINYVIFYTYLYIIVLFWGFLFYNSLFTNIYEFLKFTRLLILNVTNNKIYK